MADPTVVSDVEAMLRATGGVPVSIGGVDTYGHEERFGPDHRVDPLRFDVSPAGGAKRVSVVATGVLASPPTVGDPVTVAGDDLTVLDHAEQDDGALTVLVVGDWTHTVEIYRPPSSGTESIGQQKFDFSSPLAAGVDADIWARSGEIRAEAYGQEAVGDWEGRVPPGTDIQPGDYLKVTSGEGPVRYRVAFVGDRTPRRRIPLDLVESGEDF